MLKLLQAFDHSEVTCNFFGMRQHIVSQDERLRGEFRQEERQLAGRACPVSIKENKVKRSRKRLDDLRGVSQPQIYILRKARCEKVVLRHPVLLAATIDADDAPAFRSYRSREPNGAVSVRSANLQYVSRTRTACQYANDFRCLRLKIEQLARVLRFPGIVGLRVLLKLLQEYADFRVHLTLTFNQ